MTTSITPATATPGRDPADYDDDALDRLADLLADRLAVRLARPHAHNEPEPLVDAAEIARLHGKTRSWVYEHAGELGAVRLGSGPRPRLAFSPARVADGSRRSTSRRPRRCPSAKPRRAPTPACQSHRDGCAAARMSAVHDGLRSAPGRPRRTTAVIAPAAAATPTARHRQ